MVLMTGINGKVLNENWFDVGRVRGYRYNYLIDSTITAFSDWVR